MVTQSDANTKPDRHLMLRFLPHAFGRDLDSLPKGLARQPGLNVLYGRALCEPGARRDRGAATAFMFGAPIRDGDCAIDRTRERYIADENAARREDQLP
jgi:hypothetical protein